MRWNKEKLEKLEKEVKNNLTVGVEWSKIADKFRTNENNIRKVYEYYAKKGLVHRPSDLIIPKIDDIIEDISDKVKKVPYKEVPYKKVFKGKLDETAVLCLSDIHAGKVNKMLNIESGKVEITYNTEIMNEEFDRLIETIHTIIDLLSPTYNIRKLYIVGLGDYLDNDIIYRGQRFFIDASVGDQLMSLLTPMTKLLRSMLNIFEEIEVVSIIGNHSRFSSHREEAPVSNSFDYLFMKLLEATFSRENRIKFVIPESWFYVFDIYKWRYFIHHGDTVYAWLSIPYYGIIRRSKARMIEVPHDMEIIGHFHQRMEIPTSSRSYTLVNGSFIPKDSYAWKKFGVFSKPEQYFFGVSPKRPRTWSFDLDLSKRKKYEESK